MKTGAVTGAVWLDGWLVVTNTDRVVRIGARGGVTVLVDGLPGRGDHQTNHPVVGPDGRLYFGVGSVTNAGVVGYNNAAYGWFKANPTAHDIPAMNRPGSCGDPGDWVSSGRTGRL